MIHSQDQSKPIKFEVRMYHPSAMANAVTTTSWFYTLYVLTPSSIVQKDSPSRLEIAFLLDSGASISVLNYPTYTTLSKLLDIRPNHTGPIKFEVHMYHPTAMANAVTPTSWFYTLYVHTPSSIVQRDNPSNLEIAFLLDSGATISVLNYPTYITLTKLLDIRPNHTSDVGPSHTSKTLTVTNQTEVPI